MKVKYCTNLNCRQDNPQPIDNFYKDKYAKSGYTSRCKKCKKEYETSDKG